MKWQPIAQQIISRVFASRGIDENQHRSLSELIQEGNASAAFRKAVSYQAGDIKAGWNKAWRGHNLMTWAGSTVFAHPLRLISLEIQYMTDLDSIIRPCLNQLYGGNIDLLDGNEEEILCPYGLSSTARSIDANQLRLLQRLNTDQREHPIIERWRWSKRIGIGYFSDGGVLQISHDLAWSRALERSLNGKYGFSSLMSEFIAKIESEKCILWLPAKLDDGLINCMETLEFYGLGNRLRDTFRLKVPAGTFPMRFYSLVNEDEVSLESIPF